MRRRAARFPPSRPSSRSARRGICCTLSSPRRRTPPRVLLNSLWFNRPVAILLARPDGSGARILGRVERSIIAGPLFQRLYAEVQARHGEVGLAAIWEIRPTEIEVVDRTRWVFDESATRPFFTHLDRLAIA